MKNRLSFWKIVLIALLVAVAFAGCNREKVPQNDGTPPVTDPVTEPTETDPVIKNFHIEIGEPTVVFQAAAGEQGWGKYQFPELRHTVTGKIRARWSYGSDYIGAQDKEILYALSDDGGLTWERGDEIVHSGILMPNGRYYVNIVSYGTVSGDEVDLSGIRPAAEWMDGRAKLYFAEDLPAHEIEEHKIFDMTFLEYDPATGEVTEFESKVNWPNAPFCVHHTGYAYTISGFFDLSGADVFYIDDRMYFTVYGRGFDSFADRENAVLPDYNGENIVYIFESTDSARTWTLVSQISPDARIRELSKDYRNYTSSYEGFSEPQLVQTASGDYLMLLRTGMSRTLFYCRSSDQGRTWTQPEPFDDFGVLPQMITLDCGVTLASYGRPYLRLRATADPDCVEWEDPITIPVTSVNPDYMQRSCFYTNFLPLSDTEVLFVYSDFHYPNEEGEGVKTILVRRLTVVED